jgi:hypothetical protein
LRGRRIEGSRRVLKRERQRDFVTVERRWSDRRQGLLSGYLLVVGLWLLGLAGTMERTL